MARIYAEVYQDKKNLWRWRIRNAQNKKILADSGESLLTKKGALRAFNGFWRSELEPEIKVIEKSVKKNVSRTKNAKTSSTTKRSLSAGRRDTGTSVDVSEVPQSESKI